MKTIILVQARMSSTRLPGKVMKLIKGEPMIGVLLGRLKKVKNADQIIVSTSTDKKNDVLVEYLKSKKIAFFRGSEEDVLDRYYKSAIKFNGEIIVRITADCPLVDPALITDLINFARKSEKDYCSNIIPPTYPDGQDIEVFTFKALKKSWDEATLRSDREHVTTFIRKNSTCQKKSKFTSENFPNTSDFSHVRMTVDEPEDFDCIEILVNSLGVDKGWVTYKNFITSNYKLFNNQKIKRGLGYLKSLKQDLNK